MADIAIHITVVAILLRHPHVAPSVGHVVVAAGVEIVA